MHMATSSHVGMHDLRTQLQEQTDDVMFTDQTQQLPRKNNPLNSLLYPKKKSSSCRQKLRKRHETKPSSTEFKTGNHFFVFGNFENFVPWRH